MLPFGFGLLEFAVFDVAATRSAKPASCGAAERAAHRLEVQQVEEAVVAELELREATVTRSAERPRM